MNGGGGMAKSSRKHGQLFSMLASNDCFCHPAEGVLDSNGFLVRYLSEFPCKSDLVTKK